jgi:hypothetical protein
MVRTAGESVEMARAEIFRAARLCAPCHHQFDVLTFRADPSAVDSRRRWRDSVFLPLLAPAVCDAIDAAKAGCRELATVDRRLDPVLAAPLAAASREAGRLLAFSLEAPSNERALKRHIEAVRRGESPGHLAVLLGARASAFHTGRCMAVAALAFLEMSGAAPAVFWEAVLDCVASPAAFAAVPRAA